METPTFNFQPRILHANNREIRYTGSSGGVITQIIKYLFETGQIDGSISFRFTGTNLFEPYIAKSFNEYTQTGSIYHEIDLYSYFKNNIHVLPYRFLVTCLPCEVLPIKRLLQKNNIKAYFISLVCSSQLQKEATYFFLSKNHIDINKITNFRYRGNGWPSGIQLQSDQKEYFFHNNNSKWLYVFHSQIFTLNKCFSCIDTFGLKADISIADPWLDRYVKRETIGSSIVITHTHAGENLITEMINQMALVLDEEISKNEVILSQQGTLIKKYFFAKHKKTVKKILKIIRSNTYKKYFYRIASLHTRSILKILSLLKKLEGIK